MFMNSASRLKLERLLGEGGIQGYQHVQNTKTILLDVLLLNFIHLWMLRISGHFIFFLLQLRALD
jgi:hypothetical protein